MHPLAIAVLAFTEGYPPIARNVLSSLAMPFAFDTRRNLLLPGRVSETPESQYSVPTMSKFAAEVPAAGGTADFDLKSE